MFGKVSIIIPTRFRASLLSETLDSLAHQTNQNFEVVVVCDGEDPQTRELGSTYSAPYPIRWIFHETNEGLAAARNAGAGVAAGDVLLFLDDDVLPIEDLVAQHRKHHQEWKNRNTGIAVCGRIVETYAFPPRSSMERLMRVQRDRDLTEYEDHYRSVEMDFEKLVLLGLNSSIPRSLFLNVGGYDATFRYFGEDTELGTRLRDRGIRFCFEPSAVVYHRNVKDWIAHQRDVTRYMGRRHVYRVREKHQKNLQTVWLTSMYKGNPLKRIANRLAWRYPQIFEQAAGLCQKTVEEIGAESFFRFWCSLNKYLYWEGVKEEGATLDWLRQCVCQKVPALMFHTISIPTQENLRHYYLSPGRFLRFVKWLKVAGYKTILPPEWLAGTFPKRSVLLTFDDGYEDFYSEVFPLLQEMHFKATVFVVVDRIGQPNSWVAPLGHPTKELLSLQQIRELHQHGVQFGSHSLTHPYLTQLSDKALRREVADSKRRLEDLLSAEVTCFAYPFGDVNEQVRAAVAESGYKVAMSTVEGLNFWNDPLCLRRVNVCEFDSLANFALKLSTGRDYRQKALRSLQRLKLRLSFGEA